MAINVCKSCGGAFRESGVTCPHCAAPLPERDDIRCLLQKMYEPSTRAPATLTLALPKTGLGAVSARERLGKLYLADLSVPPSLYRQLGLEVGPLFTRAGVIPLQRADDGWLSGAKPIAVS